MFSGRRFLFFLPAPSPLPLTHPISSYLQEFQHGTCTALQAMYTAISRKVVGKIARDNPERYCGWFLVHCFSKKFQRMAREAMDVCLRVLKESNKSRFDSYSVRNSVLIISHITFRDCRVHSFSDNLSRNSCIWARMCRFKLYFKINLTTQRVWLMNFCIPHIFMRFNTVFITKMMYMTWFSRYKF